MTIANRVYDLTELIAENRGVLAMPLIQAAGTSISHWFDEKTGDVKTFVCPERHFVMPFTPFGRFIHVPPPDPLDNSPLVALPWWKDSKYLVGRLTKKKRIIRIVNMLTSKEDVITVCDEETFRQIENRYVEFNAHAASYTWKALKGETFTPVSMEGTLADNGIPDESDLYESLGMDQDSFVPTVHIYFNDDLTYA